jgi:hypothetical protein
MISAMSARSMVLQLANKARISRFIESRNDVEARHRSIAGLWSCVAEPHNLAVHSRLHGPAFFGGVWKRRLHNHRFPFAKGAVNCGLQICFLRMGARSGPPPSCKKLWPSSISLLRIGIVLSAQRVSGDPKAVG